MAGLTKEQRAAKAAVQQAAPAAEPVQTQSDAANVLMERDGKTAEVANNASVKIMAALGWRVVG